MTEEPQGLERLATAQAVAGLAWVVIGAYLVVAVVLPDMEPSKRLVQGLLLGAPGLGFLASGLGALRAAWLGRKRRPEALRANTWAWRILAASVVATGLAWIVDVIVAARIVSAGLGG